MIDKDLKNGDMVEFSLIGECAGIDFKWSSGRFVGYSNAGDGKCIVEYGGPVFTKIAYAVMCKKKQEPKKRLMTKDEYNLYNVGDPIIIKKKKE